MKTIFFDLETGGLTPQHPNIQIAAVVMEDGQEIDAFECKIHFNEADCDAQALEVNSYDPVLWRLQGKPEKFALQGFADLCQRHAWIRRTAKTSGNPYKVARLAGHNVVQFDFPRLMDRCRSLGLFLAADFPPLDTYQLAAWYFAERRERPRDLKLGTLCEWFGIQQAHAHDALSDVRATAKLASMLRADAPAPSR